MGDHAHEGRAHGEERHGAGSASGPPRRGYVWIAGSYAWTDGAYAWTPGHWERAKRDRQWTDGRWERQGDRYVWVPGQWQ